MKRRRPRRPRAVFVARLCHHFPDLDGSPITTLRVMDEGARRSCAVPAMVLFTK